MSSPRKAVRSRDILSIINLTILQEAVEFEARYAKQLGGLVMGQFFGAVAFDGQRDIARHPAAGSSTVICTAAE